MSNTISNKLQALFLSKKEKLIQSLLQFLLINSNTKFIEKLIDNTILQKNIVVPLQKIFIEKKCKCLQNSFYPNNTNYAE